MIAVAKTDVSQAASERRRRDLARLANEGFDLLIVGGGINGTGIVRDAAVRGLSCALVEKGDYASGTSSKSSKLIHGGLRYLEHGQIRLVFESTNERALLMRVAPHLVRPIEFLLPTYTRDRPGLFMLDAALWIYDALSKFSSPKLHRRVSASRLTRLEPGLARDHLRGGLVFIDCMTDDARLTLETLLDACSLGAPALNYTEVVGLKKEGGRVIGAEVRDLTDPAARPFLVRAKVVVNATGAWSDHLRRLADEDPILHTSKGAHIIVDAARLPLRHAIIMKKERRPVFAMPWGPRTVLGTTDTFFDGRPEDVVADRDDVDYLLEVGNRYFPGSKLTIDDVLATWAGLRPLLRPPTDVKRAQDVSREHKILSSPGFVTIAGGKLTTYRRMAAAVVDRAGAQLPSLPPSATAHRALPGGVGIDGAAGVERLASDLVAMGVGIDARVAMHLSETYGARARAVASRIRAEPDLASRLDPELPYIRAQIDVAVDEEQAVTLEDVLGRRVPLLLRARDQGLAAAEPIATRMAARLGWSPSKIAAEVAGYRATVARTREFRA